MSSTRKPTPVTRDQLRTQMRDTLDARALNLEQQRLIFNPSPECDSLVEHIGRLASDAPAVQVVELRRLLRRLLASNAREGECERTLAASIEQSLQGALRCPPAGDRDGMTAARDTGACVRCGHPPSDHINPSEHFKPTPGPVRTGRCLLWGCGCPGYRYALDETREAA